MENNWISLNLAVREAGLNPPDISMSSLGKRLNALKPGVTKLMYGYNGKRYATHSHILKGDVHLINKVMGSVKPLLPLMEEPSKELNLTPLYKVYRKLGYNLARGQLRTVAHELKKKGYLTEKVYDRDSRGQRAGIDESAVPVQVLKASMESLRWLTVPTEKPEKVETKVITLPTAEVKPETAAKTAEEKPKNPLYQVADLLEVYLKPDLSPILQELAEIKTELKTKTPVVVTNVENREVKNLPAPPKEINPKAIASYLEEIAGYGDPADLLQFMSAAETLKTFQPSTTSSIDDLPSHISWYGREWFNAVYTDWFRRDFVELSREQKKAIVHMLLLLSGDPYHKSLNTHKPISYHYYPAGVPDNSLYSRASNSIRIFWNFNEAEKSIVFYRIMVKNG